MNIINKLIINTIPLLPKFAVKLIANNYVAGELPQALEKVKYLNSKGYYVTIDLLGEHINDNTEVKKLLLSILIYLTAYAMNHLIVIFQLNQLISD